ncbi:MAG: hypothetical protein RLZZ59_365, partial [Pseudomonadota bacterium]
WDVPDDVEFFDQDGAKHYLEEYEGKTILLVFWATWCSPCVSEMTSLDSLQKDFRKLPFLVIPISEDYTGIKPVEAFFKNQNLRHLPILHDYKNKLFQAMNITGLPTSILINSSGKAVVTFTGSVNWYDEEVREKILSYIDGNPTLPKNSYKDKSLNNLISERNIEEKSEPNSKVSNEDSGMSSGENISDKSQDQEGEKNASQTQ